MPTIYTPQSHYETPGEGLMALCQQVYFSGHVLLQLARNDTAFPGRICTDRWCKRTKITPAPSEEPAQNANGIYGEVKQGKLRTDSKIWKLKWCKECSLCPGNQGPVCLPHIALFHLTTTITSSPILQLEGETLAGVRGPQHPVCLQMYSTWHNYHLLSV